MRGECQVTTETVTRQSRHLPASFMRQLNRDGLMLPIPENLWSVVKRKEGDGGKELFCLSPLSPLLEEFIAFVAQEKHQDAQIS